MYWFGPFAYLLCCMVIVQAVNRPPHIYIQPTTRDVFYKPGEAVELPCVATGIPSPTYKWKRNGKDYIPSGQGDRVVQLPENGTIVFNRPEDKDEGIYQCFADNGYGVSASAKVNLREAKLARFAYEDRQTHVAFIGDPLTLPCFPPMSYPAADVYWVIKEPDSRWQAINFDKRVSMDLEGRLRFTNVRKSDEQGGRAYSCMAINHFLRENATGPEHVVQVIGTEEQKRGATELWTSPTDQAFLKGQTLHLKCIFGGNPTPDVYWRKTDGVLPDRAKFKSFGQTLEIVDVEFSDAGQYMCEGNNTESSQQANKGFNIRIESGPYWIEEPMSQEKGVGESVTFVCKAGGTPKPTYSWYINSVPYDSVTDDRIDKTRMVFTPSSNNLTIIDLTLEDYMVIQCNASNKHAYVFADVFLNVFLGSTERFPEPTTETFPGPSTGTFPGPSTESSPGPGTERFPGPSTETFPGPSTGTFPGSGTERSPGPGTERFPGLSTERFPGPSTERFPGPGTERFPGTGTESFHEPGNQDLSDLQLALIALGIFVAVAVSLGVYCFWHKRFRTQQLSNPEGVSASKQRGESRNGQALEKADFNKEANKI